MKNLAILMILSALLMTKFSIAQFSRLDIVKDSLGNNSPLIVNIFIFDEASSLLFLEENISLMRPTDLFYDAIDGKTNFEVDLGNNTRARAFRPPSYAPNPYTKVFPINISLIKTLYVTYSGVMTIGGKEMLIQLLFTIDDEGIGVTQAGAGYQDYAFIPNYEIAHNAIEVNARELNALIVGKINSGSQGFMADKKTNERDHNDQKEK